MTNPKAKLSTKYSNSPRSEGSSKRGHNRKGEVDRVKTDPIEFDKFIRLLPKNVNPHFIPVRYDKSPDVPRGESSKDDKYKLTIGEARSRIKEGGNVATYLRDDFAVLDVDDPKKARDYLDDDITKKTLTVRSRSGKPHLWFLRGEGIEGRDIPNVVELRTGWRYVLVPGSCAYDKSEFEDTGRKQWGLYSVANANEPTELCLKDLPRELKPKASEDVHINLSGEDEEVDLVNVHGWKLHDVRHRDQKLDKLLSELNPRGGDYPSRSEADLGAMQKLLYWEFSDNTICHILRRFRPYEKTEREDYLERTLKKAKSRTEETISQNVNPSSWNPVDGLKYLEKGKFVPKYLAEEIMDDHNFLTLEDTEEVYVFQAGAYVPKGETMIKSETQDKLGKYSRTHYRNEVVNYIQSATYTPRTTFDRDPHKVVVKNGVLNLKTRELAPHSPNPPSLVKIPVKYDPDAECPEIKNFLKDILHHDDISTIQEGIGYCLLKDYPISTAFMLIGSGANGKSTLLNLIARFLGEENVATPSLQDLLHNRFAKAKLFGKLANVHADIPSVKLKSTGAFKMLTGQDLIYAEKKYQSAFTYRNHAKLWFSCNELPFTSDRTPAFFERWILIDFPNRFPRDDPQTDPHIIDKITTKEELSGLLNWALEGLHNLLDRGYFETSKSQEEVEGEWILQTDSLGAFVRISCEANPLSVIKKSDFYYAYLDFCDDRNLPAVQPNIVGRRLPSIAPYVRASQRTIAGRRERCWEGITTERLKKPSQDTQFNYSTLSCNDEGNSSYQSKIVYRKGSENNLCIPCTPIRETITALRGKIRDLLLGMPLETKELLANFDRSDHDRVGEVVNKMFEEGEIFKDKNGCLRLAHE